MILVEAKSDEEDYTTPIIQTQPLVLSLAYVKEFKEHDTEVVV